MSSKNKNSFRGEKRTKFIRNRDIILKGKEVKKEVHIQKSMCEGICPRCRDKAQWRFKYDKYKPLKSIGNCQGCKRKCITKAYRTLCDECATSRKACSSCCCDLAQAIQEDLNRKADAGCTEGGDSGEIEGTPRTTGVEDAVLAEEDDDMDDDEDEEDEEEEEALDDASSASKSNPGKRILKDWDESTFRQIATTKYSKQRVAGREETVYEPRIG